MTALLIVRSLEDVYKIGMNNKALQLSNFIYFLIQMNLLFNIIYHL